MGVRQRTPPWQVSPELLDAYQKSFMELDLACRGFLEIDALKVSPCDAFIEPLYMYSPYLGPYLASI